MSNSSSAIALAIILAASGGSCGGANHDPSLEGDAWLSDARILDSRVADAQPYVQDAGPSEPDAGICVPACGSSMCGPDPVCGVECGICPDRHTCDGGACIELRWGTPVKLSIPDWRYAYDSDVQVDESGNAIVVFHQYYDDNMGAQLQARYDASTDTWSDVWFLATDQYHLSEGPRIGMDAAGNAVVAWNSNSQSSYIDSSRYDASSGIWSPPVRIVDTSGSGTYRPRLSVDPAGHAMAVWDYSDGVQNIVWASHYDVSTNQWGFPVALGEGLAQDVSMDHGGNAIAIWYRPSSDPPSGTWTKRYDAASGTWDSVPRLIAGGTYSNGGYKVRSDPAGNALAVWSDWQAETLWARRYDVATDMWGPHFSVHHGTGSHDFPELSIDRYGNAIVIWLHPAFLGPNDQMNIWSRRYDAATDRWGPVIGIGDASSGNGGPPHVSMDALGNAVAVFAQGPDATERTIWSNRYRVSSDTWGTAERIDGVADGAYNARVSVNSSGQAVAVWKQRVGNNYSIWANRLAPLPAPSP